MLLSRKLLALSTYPSRQLFTSGSGSIVLPQGRYTVVIRGGGGGGGGPNPNTSYHTGTCGRGGRGAIVTQSFVLSDTTRLDYYVGSGGLAAGNGGVGGGSLLNGLRSFSGGGGGYPSYIYIQGTYFHANGGGGGGGAGNSFRTSDQHGTGGGGGGGYYRFNNGSIVSISGANGGTASTNATGTGGNGNTQDFPSLYGQNGGDAGSVNGSRGGSGGGAGGGGGAYTGTINKYGGSGGGGAGGDLEAGGGTGGYNNNGVQTETPTVNAGAWAGLDTTQENANYGVTGNYGSSGQGLRVNATSVQNYATNGVGGFVLIIKEP